MTDNSNEGILFDVRNLTGGYENLVVLKNVSMKVLKGEILVVVGRSGCGKSTLMRYLLGLAVPWSGRILYHGEDIFESEGEILTKARKSWGVLFQSGALLGSLNLVENVALPLTEFSGLSKMESEMVARKKLDLVGLSGFYDSLPLEVSGGMQKRAALARAMALDPEVLFFDEPSAGLDPVTSSELDSLIQTLNKNLGTTTVIVTHELSSIFAISERVIMLDTDAQGIIAEGTAMELKENLSDKRVHAFFNRFALSEGEVG